jgi:hypothetical protein
MGNLARNLIGQRSGRVVVIARDGTNAEGRSTWVVQCDCGTVKRGVEGRLLTRGSIRSCGCLRREVFERAQVISRSIKVKPRRAIPSKPRLTRAEKIKRSIAKRQKAGLSWGRPLEYFVDRPATATERSIRFRKGTL